MIAPAVAKQVVAKMKTMKDAKEAHIMALLKKNGIRASIGDLTNTSETPEVSDIDIMELLKKKGIKTSISDIKAMPDVVDIDEASLPPKKTVALAKILG